MISRQESLFFLIFRTSFQIVKAEMCYIYETINNEKRIVAYIYCDPNLNDCCDTGCCKKVVTYQNETDSVLVFIYIVLSVSALLILTRCFSCLCKPQMSTPLIVDTRYDPPALSDVAVAPPLTPPPSYREVLLQVPPSYEEVVSGKVT